METEQSYLEAMQDETLAAFMCVLDDITANTNAPEANADDEISAKVLGLFDTASTFYDADMVKNLELVNSLAARLGELTCGGHSYLESTMDEVNNRFSPTNDEHTDHNHEDDNEKGKKKKRKSQHSSWWMHLSHK